MDEILARVWKNLIGRLAGPMNLRLVLQPTVAAILGFRAGLRDARQNRPPFFWAVFFKATSRRELLRQGWKDAGRVFILATILDVIYQLIVHRGVYVLELLITVVTLAIFPYILVRGAVNRIATLVSHRHAPGNKRGRSQHVFHERDFLPGTGVAGDRPLKGTRRKPP